MGYSNKFFRALGVAANDQQAVTNLSRKTGIPVSRLCYYNENNILPTGSDLEAILRVLKVSEEALMLKMGRLDSRLMEAIQGKADEILSLIKPSLCNTKVDRTPVKLVFQTKLGKLYQGDCLSLMKELDNNSVDLVFADPPFNLNKLYPSNIDDSLKTEKYINWCKEWLSECIRILKNGGSLFIWNLPKWNAALTEFLGGRVNFRHWIAVDIKCSFPIQGRLYPSHYSLLYYVKGEKPNVFHPDRLPMPICPHCFGDLKDYGGYKNKMNPKGVNLTDVWLDIPPVRHAKYKRRSGANELSIKLLDRVIEMASNEGDVVFDPFGGSGTTYIVSEIKKRKWVGVELGPVDDIVNRFNRIEEEREVLSEYRRDLNCLFTDEAIKNRHSRGLWTTDTIKENGVSKHPQVDCKQIELDLTNSCTRTK